MTATQQLEVAHLMLKQAGKWDKLWRAGQLGTDGLVRGFARTSAPAGLNMNSLLEMGGGANGIFKNLARQMEGRGIPSGRIGASSSHRATMRDVRGTLRGATPRDILGNREPGAVTTSQGYRKSRPDSYTDIGRAAGINMRTPNLP